MQHNATGTLQTAKSHGRELAFVFFAVTLVAPSVAPAAPTLYQAVPIGENVPVELIERHLSARYSVRELVVRLKQGEGGPEGNITIRGDLTPRNARVPARPHDPRSRARTLTTDFLEQEAAMLFGIPSIRQLREFKTFTNDLGWTKVILERYVGGLQLEGAEILLNFDPQGRLASVRARLVPVSPGLAKALERKTLSEKEIRRIVAQDPEWSNVLPRYRSLEMKLVKIAVASSPYVVWKVESRVWDYTIDAFTGTILTKLPRWYE